MKRDVICGSWWAWRVEKRAFGWGWSRGREEGSWVPSRARPEMNPALYRWQCQQTPEGTRKSHGVFLTTAGRLVKLNFSPLWNLWPSLEQFHCPRGKGNSEDWGYWTNKEKQLSGEGYRDTRESDHVILRLVSEKHTSVGMERRSIKRSFEFGPLAL